MIAFERLTRLAARRRARRAAPRLETDCITDDSASGALGGGGVGEPPLALPPQVERVSLSHSILYVHFCFYY